MEPDADYQLTVGSITDSSKLLIVGDTSSSQSAKLYVYNLAVWESHVPHQMINQLMGMSSEFFFNSTENDTKQKMYKVLKVAFIRI